MSEGERANNHANLSRKRDSACRDRGAEAMVDLPWV